MGIASLALPLPAHAGGLHVDIGLEIPVPAPPVVVAPYPVIIQPAPVIVQRAPVVVAPYPVVIPEPRVVHERWLPPGIAKKYYGKYPKHWKHHHHDHDDD